MEGRDNPLAIVQGETCVSYFNHLVKLRKRFNEVIWFPMSECGVEEGREYGRTPWQEEIDDLPTVESFFHLNVTTALEGGVPTATEGSVDWYVSGGTLLDRVQDTGTWSYFNGPTDLWYVHLKDVCHGCSKLMPSAGAGFSDAEVEIECPKDTNTNRYTGIWKTATWGSAPGVCSIKFDWGTEAAAVMRKAFLKVPAYIVCADDPESPEDCCYFEGHLCKGDCSVPFVAYYEYGRDVDGGQELWLKGIDVGTEYPSTTGVITGYAAPYITSAKLDDIKDRVEAQMDNWIYKHCRICDKCGPTEDERCMDPVTNPNGYAFKCPTPMSWEAVRTSFSITKSESCAPCGEGFSGTVCGCPWNELHSVMDRIASWGCLTICDDPCVCDCSSSSSSSSGSSSSSESSSGF